MNVQLKPKRASSLCETDILFQSSYWSRVKSSLGWSPIAFDYTSSTGLRGDMLMLVWHFHDGVSGAYVPQGPECGPDPEHYGLFLEELSEAAAGHLDPTVAFIQYDLPWKSPYAGAAQGADSWTGRPEARLQELRMNFGTRRWNLEKSHLDLTPADSVVIDLSLSEEELLSGMKPKTRYNIRLAHRKGVRVSMARPGELPAFYNLYRQTAERNGFHAASFRHFQALFPADGARVVFLLAARGRDLLAGAIVTVSGRKATYLFGASSNENRNLMGCYALQWEAMRIAKTRGCLVYDLGAVAPADDQSHPFYGMRRFKTGFGGSIFHGSGTWDYPLNREGYRMFRNFESFFGIPG